MAHSIRERYNLRIDSKKIYWLCAWLGSISLLETSQTTVRRAGTDWWFSDNSLGDFVGPFSY